MLVFNKIQTTELTVTFVLVGMIFLVPAITQSALGATGFNVYRTNVDLTKLSYYLDAGVFNEPPPKEVFGNVDVWFNTQGSGFYGDEKGYVQYHVLDKDKKDLGTVTIEFSNPAKGANTCSAKSSQGIGTKCTISQAVSATVNWCVWYNSPESTKC